MKFDSSRLSQNSTVPLTPASLLSTVACVVVLSPAAPTLTRHPHAPITPRPSPPPPMPSLVRNINISSYRPTSREKLQAPPPHISYARVVRHTRLTVLCTSPLLHLPHQEPEERRARALCFWPPRRSDRSSKLHPFLPWPLPSSRHPHPCAHLPFLSSRPECRGYPCLLPQR